MIKVAVAPCASPLNQGSDYSGITDQVKETLEKFGLTDTIVVNAYGEVPEHDVAVVVVLGGGSEPSMFRFLQNSTAPFVMLARTSGNALPAALDMMSIAQEQGKQGSIVPMIDGWEKELEEFLAVLKCHSRLQRSRIGVIGIRDVEVMPPLILKQKIKRVWGPELVYLDISDLVVAAQAVDLETARESAEELMRVAAKVVEPDLQTVIGAVRIYHGLRDVVRRYRLDGVTVKCFDLLPIFDNTGCYALARLNEEGIPAGCESDVQSVLGMLFLKELTGHPAFMANPVSIDTNTGLVLLAHCTIARNMVDSFVLRSHLESGLGVGIQGRLGEGTATLFRLGGHSLKRALVTNCSIVATTPQEDMCRTQVKVRVSHPRYAESMIADPLGNHHLLIKGHWAQRIERYLAMCVAQR